jgi:BolA protein
MNMTPTVADQIAQRLRQRLAPTRLEVLDESCRHVGHPSINGAANDTGLGTHFRVRIATPDFAQRSRIARHRLVYDALADFMTQGVHAIAIETF